MNTEIKKKLGIVRRYVNKSDIVLGEFGEALIEFYKDEIVISNIIDNHIIPHEKIVDITIGNSIAIYWSGGEGENEFTHDYSFTPLVYASNIFKEH